MSSYTAPPQCEECGHEVEYLVRHEPTGWQVCRRCHAFLTLRGVTRDPKPSQEEPT